SHKHPLTQNKPIAFPSFITDAIRVHHCCAFTARIIATSQMDVVVWKWSNLALKLLCFF
ncbi:hypothetical protein CUMW_172200, partial [Citrus unshiu]